VLNDGGISGPPYPARSGTLIYFPRITFIGRRLYSINEDGSNMTLVSTLPNLLTYDDEYPSV